jgi:hypothetical protein
MKNYRNAFILMLITSVLLATGLAVIGWRYALHGGGATAVASPLAATTSAGGGETSEPVARPP